MIVRFILLLLSTGCTSASGKRPGRFRFPTEFAAIRPESMDKIARCLLTICRSIVYIDQRKPVSAPNGQTDTQRQK